MTGKGERRGARGLDSPETPDRPEPRASLVVRQRSAMRASQNGDGEPETAGSSGAVMFRFDGQCQGCG